MKIYHDLDQYSINGDKFVARLIATLVKYGVTSNPETEWTWGQELEIYDDYIQYEFFDVSERWLKGMRDGSGPWEFVLYPTKYSDPTPAFIIAELQRRKIIDIRPQSEMGNHLHIRPGPITINNIKLWHRTFINTFILSVLAMRLMSSHGGKLRRTWTDWATMTTVPEIPVDKYDDEALYNIRRTLERYYGRNYHHITLNRNRKDILTIEVRMCEAHPIKAWTFAYLLTLVTKKYRKPLFLVEDIYKFEEYYVDLADGCESDAEEVDIEEIGLRPLAINISRFSPKQLIQKLINKLAEQNNIGYLAKRIIQYIYSGNDIVDRESVIRFYEYLRKKR